MTDKVELGHLAQPQGHERGPIFHAELAIDGSDPFISGVIAALQLIRDQLLGTG